MKNLLILGAGQYGSVVKQVAASMGIFDKIEFLDDNNPQAIGKLIDCEKYLAEFSYAFVSIGNAEVRQDWLNKLEKIGFKLAVLISPKSYVDSSAQISGGSIVEPMAVVNANSTLSKGVFVCAGAIVNHNSFVGDVCQLDCGSVVGSNVNLPAKTKLKYNEVFDNERAEIAHRCPSGDFKFEDGM
jgi:acetyltransferase-like isoleucine patch superfamily enzyme